MNQFISLSYENKSLVPQDNCHKKNDFLYFIDIMGYLWINSLSCDCARTFRSQCWQASIITAQLV